jgi:hypothetical protein
MNLDDLKKEFPFKWRVQSFSKQKPMATCVPYCDSRQVQDVLDSVCGIGGWQDKYEEVGGVLYCHIGIKYGDEWVWKSDCGTQSNTEKEKGQASDAFKRAAVKWGIGRFLYSMRMYNIKANKKKEDGDKPWHIHCVDDKGNKIPDWYITDYINGKRGSAKAVPASDPDAKGDEASSELRTLEDFLAKFSDDRVLTSLEWLGFKRTKSELKNEGVADVPRAKYGILCNLVKLTGYDTEIFEMCLEGFGYKPIAEGGIDEMIKAEKVDSVIDECEAIRKQESANA